MKKEETIKEIRTDAIQKLRESGCRITKQRLIILDVILEGNCFNCKETYYEALRRDPKIGMATVYRMVHTLEDLRVIRRESGFRVIRSEL